MEGGMMNQMGQEEYIWAMRTCALREGGDSNWKETGVTRGGHSGDDLSLTSAKADKAEQKMSDHQTKVMASLIPDEVIYNINDFEHRPYEACFLFGDVSGFTELCEKYNKQGISGPSRMTQVLNKYLGAMVQEVMSHNGDVLKFSGDAFLAMWKVTESDNMRDSVHQAIDCALVIQKSYGSYETDVGVIIRVKLAVSAGHVVFGLIGDQRNAHYVVVGKPIWDVKAAEHKCVAGDIIVAPAGWHYVNTSEYLYELMTDGVHNKILGIGPNWRSVQKNVRQQRVGRSPSDEAESLGDDDSNSLDLSLTHKTEATEDFSLRPSVNEACKLDIKQDMRKFIILPVMTSIDSDEPFEYLTEMRQSVVVFINIICSRCEIKESVRIADQAYKCVCRTVNDHKGCVNKVSFFDKDLMLVVIFGLRGLKHELESQIALRCASEFQQGILRIRKVISASVGITTGKTYCGVFGHTLRREYTVISLIVNKAARLMCAYKDKVTCDRETFLHSKLEAKNFILQEFKNLKGISSPGPVYEFREFFIGHEDIVHKISFFPLLGRDDEMEIFKEVLEEFLKANRLKRTKKVLLIQGTARQGKTRVLEEMLYVSPSSIPANRFNLTAKDKKIPYLALRLLFYVPLGILTDSSIKLKEHKLVRALSHMRVPELLCILNNPFGVEFRQSELFQSLTKEQKRIALYKMIRQLCYGCFTTTWIIVIDDLEYIDTESAELLPAVMESKSVFIMATMGPTTNPNLIRLRADRRVASIQLKAIERWYHGGLACQILDVYAIPPELEKVIQARSNGNPGWIESFLVSLLQSDGIYIVTTDLKRIHELGLVCPPLYMMSRMAPEKIFEWKKAMEERSASLQSLDEDRWKIYIDTCRDSYMNIHLREKLEVKFKNSTAAPVCFIAKDFNIEDVDAELSMDVIILKTFDSLTSYEQLLVKCSAILGVQFLRDMLLYVMSASVPKQAAMAVKKLFEIRVLCCAKGDFLEEGNMVYRERLLNPNDENTLGCECRGIKIDESCYDLPKYASCGYMQFRSSMFRDITYNLLTDNQKKEFHYRAIRYLEKETRRCRACGNGFFNEIVGARREEDFVGRKNKGRGKGRDAVSRSWDDTGTLGTIGTHASTHSGGQGKRGRSFDVNSISDSVTGTVQLLEDQMAQKNRFNSGLGFSLIRRLKNSFSLTRAFSNDDFRDCQCNLILLTTYSQLVQHCKGAGNVSKTIDAKLEYAYVCIISCNVPLAIRTLNEGLQMLEESEADKKTKDGDKQNWKLSLKRGKILTLIGYSRMELGQIHEAIDSLNMALHEHGLVFPKDSTSKRLLTLRHELKQYLGLYCCTGTLNRNVNKWESLYCNNVAECLSHLCTIFIAQERWADAEVAATWALSKALEAYNNFQVVCVAYADMIRVAYHMNKKSLCTALEVHALRLCHLKKMSVEADELKAVAKLYGEIFCTRLARSNVDKAIHIGYIVLRISSSIHAVKVIMPLLPLLMMALLMGQHISNAISILQDIDYFAEEDTDNSGRLWYFALCLCFNLETGYTAVPYSRAEQFFQVQGDNIVTIRDPDARKRFFAVMWLWCIRNGKWEAAALWCVKTENFNIVSKMDSMNNKITALYLLEGLILYLVCKMDKRNIHARLKAEEEIESLMTALEKSSDLSLMILPRFYHLKAYYRLVKYNDSKAFTLLNKAAKLAVKYDNGLELAYIEHSEKAWLKNMTTATATFWKEHNDPENLLDYHELEMNQGKLGFYTLPAPIYM